jgi:hypothetical protein
VWVCLCVGGWVWVGVGGRAGGCAHQEEEGGWGVGVGVYGGLVLRITFGALGISEPVLRRSCSTRRAHRPAVGELEMAEVEVEVGRGGGRGGAGRHACWRGFDFDFPRTPKNWR